MSIEIDKDELTVAYMAGSASRLDELRAKDAEISALRQKLDVLQRRATRHSLAKDLGSAVEADAVTMSRIVSDRDAALDEIEALRKSNTECIEEINEMSHNCNEFKDEIEALRKEVARWNRADPHLRRMGVSVYHDSAYPDGHGDVVIVNKARYELSNLIESMPAFAETTVTEYANGWNAFRERLVSGIDRIDNELKKEANK